MILRRLQLQHFRNYRRLDLSLEEGVTVLYGSNGAGKTNILEAVFALATTKSFRARTDRELIDRRFEPLDGPFPFARLSGEADTARGTLSVEMIIGLDGATDAPVLRKRFRLDGTARKAVDVVGRLKAVLFSPVDVDIVTGSPSLRRRFVDLMLCQVDSSYLRLLQSYTRVVQQRNAALSRFGARMPAQQLDFWDQRLMADGSEIIGRRLEMMEWLGPCAAEMYMRLSGGGEAFAIEYVSSLGEIEGLNADVQNLFSQRLRALGTKGLEQRLTLVGPHRDDLSMTLDGVPLPSFGSRGQHRTAALAMRMAEAAYILHRTGERPIMLLDEALGELDDRRRDHLLDFTASHPQVLLTGTTADLFPQDFRRRGALIHVEGGAIAA